MDERGGQSAPPLHPAGVGLRATVRRLGEADELEQLFRPLSSAASENAVEPALQRHQRTPGLARIEPDLLPRDADPPPNLGALMDDIEAGYRRGAGARRQQRAEH